jgi:hypothetical protein
VRDIVLEEEEPAYTAEGNIIASTKLTQFFYFQSLFPYFKIACYLFVGEIGFRCPQDLFTVSGLIHLEEPIGNEYLFHEFIVGGGFEFEYFIQEGEVLAFPVGRQESEYILLVVDDTKPYVFIQSVGVVFFQQEKACLVELGYVCVKPMLTERFRLSQSGDSHRDIGAEELFKRRRCGDLHPLIMAYESETAQETAKEVWRIQSLLYEEPCSELEYGGGIDRNAALSKVVE